MISFDSSSSTFDGAALGFFSPALAQLRAESREHFNCPSVSIEPLSCMTRQGSRLLRVQVRTSSESFFAYIKLYNVDGCTPEYIAQMRQRGMRDFETTRRVHLLMQSVSGISTLRPIAFLPDHLAVVTEEVHGTTLGQLLTKKAGWYQDREPLDDLCTVMSRIGVWLRTIQTLDVQSERFSLDGMREYLDVRLVRLVRHGGLSARDRCGILRFFDERSADVPETDLQEVVIHGDLSPSNVMSAGTNVTVLDFEMWRTGSVFHDLSRIYHQIELRKLKPWFRPSSLDRLLEATIAGFDPTLRPERPLFELLTLQHVINKLTKLTTQPVGKLSGAYSWYVSQCLRRWLRTRGVN
jgi:hypothetical protein